MANLNKVLLRLRKTPGKNISSVYNKQQTQESWQITTDYITSTLRSAGLEFTFPHSSLPLPTPSSPPEKESSCGAETELDDDKQQQRSDEQASRMATTPVLPRPTLGTHLPSNPSNPEGPSGDKGGIRISPELVQQLAFPAKYLQNITDATCVVELLLVLEQASLTKFTNQPSSVEEDNNNNNSNEKKNKKIQLSVEEKEFIRSDVNARIGEVVTVAMKLQPNNSTELFQKWLQRDPTALLKGLLFS